MPEKNWWEESPREFADGFTEEVQVHHENPPAHGPQHDVSRQENEAAYRRGWQQGMSEATLLLLQLVELGYDRRKIKQLMAIYEDHFISEWRNNGDLEKREPFPAFNIEQIEEIAATHRGYDWLLNEA
jgi:hypothetical protein